MLKIPKKVLERFVKLLKNYQTVALSQKNRDVSEADTVTLVKDILAYVFGYDKYNELTSEQQIRGTFCDLAVKIEGKIKYLIEVKSAGIELNEAHIRQATNYAANEGIEWVVLTNAITWQLYRVKFGQPIETERVFSFDFASLNPKNEDDQDKLFLLCREGITNDAMDRFHQQAQMLNKFTLTQIMISEPIINLARKEFRKLFPELKVDAQQISEILIKEVIKRDVIESEKMKAAQQKIKKAEQKLMRQAKKGQMVSQKELVPVLDLV